VKIPQRRGKLMKPPKNPSQKKPSPTKAVTQPIGPTPAIGGFPGVSTPGYLRGVARGAGLLRGQPKPAAILRGKAWGRRGAGAGASRRPLMAKTASQPTTAGRTLAMGHGKGIR